MINDSKIKNVMGIVFGISSNSITEESSMDSIPNWDSLRHMNLILALEEEFNVQIPDEEAGNITSYQLVKIVIDDLTRAQS